MGEHASLFVANKLAYFLQRLGENLRFSFKPHHYGPYSVGVGHFLYGLNGVYMMGMEQKEVKAFESFQLRYDKLNEVRDYVNKELQPEQRQRLENLRILIAGFQSALSLEVLASVDFVQSQEGLSSVDAVFKRLQDWLDRKKRLIQERHVIIAVEQLDSCKQHPAFI